MKPSTTEWFRCLVVLWRWTMIRNALTSEAIALSTIPSTCSRWWSISLWSQGQFWLPTLPVPRTTSPTISTITWLSTIHSLTLKRPFSELLMVTRPSACPASVSTETLITWTPAFSRNSLWTISPQRNALLSPQESETTVSTLISARSVSESCLPSQSTCTAVRNLNTSVESLASGVRAQTRILLWHSSLSPGLTMMFQHSMLQTPC